MMTNTAHKLESCPTEYAVYIYHQKSKTNRHPKWEKVRESRNVKRALLCATAIQRKGKYEKIEIKKKFYCPNENKIIGKTVRIVQNKENSLTGAIKNIIAQAQNP